MICLGFSPTVVHRQSRQFQRDLRNLRLSFKVTEASVLTEKNGIETENGTANGHGIERTANKETDVSVV